MVAEECDCLVDMFQNDAVTNHPCGCEGTTCAGYVRVYRDHGFHWRGTHWRAGCLVKEATSIIDDTNETGEHG